MDLPGETQLDLFIESNTILKILFKYRDTDYLFCLCHPQLVSKELSGRSSEFSCFAEDLFFTGNIYYTKVGGDLSSTRILEELLQ